MIILIINENTNTQLLLLWFLHYIKLNLIFKIFVENIDKIKYSYKYIDKKYFIKKINSSDNIILTEYDFIFSYKKQDECMILSRDIQDTQLNTPQIIGRVFSVPINDKPIYTTFEIPDFILYNHIDHTNYTNNGIKILTNNNTNVSKNIVCLSMKISNYSMITEYYENNILFDNNVCEIVYKEYFHNCFVNKEHKYGIIWNYNCESTIITKFFAYYNELNMNDTHNIVDQFIKYRYNNYLQNIKIIHFIKHPFLRFISCYFNKHINRCDPNYLLLDNYLLYLKQYNNLDTILNFAKYLKDRNIIDDHSTNLSDLYYLHKYNKLKYENYDIDDNLNNKLNEIFLNYHNKNPHYILEPITNHFFQYNKQFKNYTYQDWIQFKKTNNQMFPNYESIIDAELMNILKIIYKKDIINFNYNKIINHTIPNNFNPELYRMLNPDLTNLNNNECIIHYINYGINEKRLYTIDLDKLPSNFDVYQYLHFNNDLHNMNNIQLITHYILHGIKEKRKYIDNYFCKEFFCKKNKYENTTDIYLKYISDIRQEKNFYFKIYVDNVFFDLSQNYLFLVNHDTNCYGASHYLYLLYNFLKNNLTDINILLCEVNINHTILQKYNIDRQNVIEYKNDPTLLYLLYEKINPKIIYFNSCNHSIYTISSYIPENKCIYHSHEIKDHYLLSNKISPTFVVSDRISNLYKSKPLIQPPIIPSIQHIMNLSNESIEDIKNKFGKIDLNKINIGMCGQITERKNYMLFIEISTYFSQYNFLWIGDNSTIFDNYSNIYHIKNTLNPYKYFKQILDYFILFSIADPCPYVVLENLLLETPMITFRDNIYYDHKNEMIQHIYHEYPSFINKQNVIDSIEQNIKNKKNITTNNGRKYIETYFTNLNNISSKIYELLNISK